MYCERHMRLLVLGLLLSASAVAQTTAPSTNPSDISNFKDIASGSSLPTVASVNALKTQAESLVSASKCTEALPVLAEWATQANVLSNLLIAGMEPYYSSTSSERNGVSLLPILEVIVPYEKLANDFKKDRNIATVMRAECLASTGKPNEAAAVFARALELISLSEKSTWNRAATGLYKLIDQPAPKL